MVNIMTDQTQNPLEPLIQALAEGLKPFLVEIIQSELNKKQKQPEQHQPELITEIELAKRLNKSKVTLWNWRKKGLLSYRKINRSIYYDYSKVLDELKNYNLS